MVPWTDGKSYFMKEIDLILLAFPTLKLLCTSPVMSCVPISGAQLQGCIALRCIAFYCIVLYCIKPVFHLEHAGIFFSKILIEAQCQLSSSSRRMEK